ncbi:hypothetical protein NP233_g2914 [Leucocoprinus birnbaumii]|uniref:Uncharacterized protein n=1 Tax=Leucocoprinus birnbaumii TaxID=56174 RepID=A0AAD5YUF4_9AGAR|nr:hypothetical protein NP233_g2914 [Leucocoprinus birnbaumii]
METTFSSFPLTSLTSWSKQHIHDIFEASSDDEALRALDKTFARDVEASVNGKPIRYQDIQGMVLGLRKGSRLRVSWQQARESPRDPSTNSSGAFSGTYIIRGIQRLMPGSDRPVEFERHKTVQVHLLVELDALIVATLTAALNTSITPFKAGKLSSKTPTTRIQDSTPSGSSASANYRLLYRGALSLPDSYLLLDGLTFSARLESPTKHHLLENPLALALESMRGRQSLRFLGTVKLRDVWLDESGNVEMDIHPRAALSRVYFENIFCLLPFPPASTSQLYVADSPAGTRSELGIKIALGDTDGPDTTHIIVFGQVTSPTARSIKLRVARITSHPPPKSLPRVPRPDDPTPRRPPIAFGRTKSIGAGALKRTASSSSSVLALHQENGVSSKKLKLTANAEKHQPKPLTGDKVFKVPPLPGKARGKGKEKEDVFGPRPLFKKISTGDVSENGQDADENELERANKKFHQKCNLGAFA